MYYHYQIGTFVPLLKRFYKQFVVAFVALFVATLAVTTLGVHAATLEEDVSDNTVDTTLGENGSEGWWFNRDESTSTPYNFIRGEASIGDGSLFVKPIGANPSDKFIAENFVFMNVSDLESIAYDFMIAGNGDSGDAGQFYLNVYTNLPGTSIDNFYDCRFDFTPSSGSVTDFTTFTITSATTPVSVRSRGGATCPTTLNGLAAGSTIRMFSISVGDSGSGDFGLAGYLDNVVLVTTSDEIIYDFEPFKETLEITSPDENERVMGNVVLSATYNDGDEMDDDAVQWSLRQNTCAAGSGSANVAGNTAGNTSPFSWDGTSFSATIDTTQFVDGEYCFVINPNDDNYDTRATRVFFIDNHPDEKNECKAGGWAAGLESGETFRNQGDCISFFSTEGHNPPTNGSRNERTNRNR